MTYAITLVKCDVSKDRGKVIDYLIDLSTNKVKLSHEVEIADCYISFGWPDLVLILKGPNVELLKDAIINLRDKVKKGRLGNLETSTLICTTREEITNAKEMIKNRDNKKI